MNYWNQKQECMPRNELEALQGERLRELVAYEYERVPLYRAKMDAAGVKPPDIRTLADITKLPFTTKQDLRDAYPYGMFAAPMSEINRIHASSGTTGKQTVCGYTKSDLEVWKECMSRSLAGAGATKESVVHVSYGYGLFTGGLGAHYGAEYLGALVIPMSTGNTKKLIDMMVDCGATAIACTPSYFLRIMDEAKKQGVDFRRDTKLKHGIFGAEPWTEEMRQKIEDLTGITAHDIYGLTEISGPGVSFECSEQSGMHINEDHFIAEIINPNTGEVLPEGTKGELVFTCLDKEAFPLLRYRTRDICVLSRRQCSCGRTFIRMTKPMGRSDDMLIIRGVNVFPSQIEAVLLKEGYEPNYQIVVDRVNNSDTFDILVEMDDEMFADTVAGITKREKALVAAMRTMLGISPTVHLVAPKSIARSEGKAVRVVDKRKLLSDSQWKG